MPITTKEWRPITEYSQFYAKLEEHDKIFSNKSHIFGFVLALGYILKKRSTKQPTSSAGGFVRLLSPYQEQAKKYPMYMEISDFIFDHYAEGNGQRERLKDMDRIADAGIEFLMEEDEKQGLPKIDISQIIQAIKDQTQPTTT